MERCYTKYIRDYEFRFVDTDKGTYISNLDLREFIGYQSNSIVYRHTSEADRHKTVFDGTVILGLNYRAANTVLQRTEYEYDREVAREILDTLAGTVKSETIVNAKYQQLKKNYVLLQKEHERLAVDARCVESLRDKVEKLQRENEKLAMLANHYETKTENLLRRA